MFDTYVFALFKGMLYVVYKSIVLHTFISHLQFTVYMQGTHCARNTAVHLFKPVLPSSVQFTSSSWLQDSRLYLHLKCSSQCGISTKPASSHYTSGTNCLCSNELPQPSFNMQIWTIFQKDGISREDLLHLNTFVSQSPVFY